MWRRDEDLRIESAASPERFIEDVGFTNTMTDAPRAGPSLYIAVSGRRDVSLPRNVRRTKRRASLGTSRTKSCAVRVYYAKLAGGRSMFVALALISHFAAIWMPRRKDEPLVLSVPAQRVLKVLRREHELATADLRANRVEAGSGNHQLVDEGYAIGLRQGIYALASMKNSLANDYRAA